MKPWLLFLRNCSNGSLVDKPIPLNMSILSRASPALIGSTMPCSDEPRPPPSHPELKKWRKSFNKKHSMILQIPFCEDIRGKCFHTQCTHKYSYNHFNVKMYSYNAHALKTFYSMTAYQGTRLGGAMVTRSPLTAKAWVWLWLWAACGMSFTLHSQCLMVFRSGFFSTLRRAQNCSDWNCLIRPTGLARTCPGWRKINGFTFTFYPSVANKRELH